MDESASGSEACAVPRKDESNLFFCDAGGRRKGAKQMTKKERESEEVEQRWREKQLKIKALDFSSDEEEEDEEDLSMQLLRSKAEQTKSEEKNFFRDWLWLEVHDPVQNQWIPIDVLNGKVIKSNTAIGRFLEENWSLYVLSCSP